MGAAAVQIGVEKGCNSCIRMRKAVAKKKGNQESFSSYACNRGEL
jgi:hypothetical protein